MFGFQFVEVILVETLNFVLQVDVSSILGVKEIN